MLDLVIHDALIIDGSGAPPYRGSLGIKNGNIHEVWNTPKSTMAGEQVIDAKGQVVCPGFIDTHTHSDLSLLHNGLGASSITQGVTCELLGQDGLSYVPLDGEKLQEFVTYMSGINGLISDTAFDFTSVESYLSQFEGRSNINVAYLLPHGALRLAAADFSNRGLSSLEMDRAKGLIYEGMSQGAVGMSSGLSYFPGAYGDTDELVELCRIVEKFGGVYATHLRTVFQSKPFDAVDEALEIARRSGVKLHFSHYRTGLTTFGQVDQIMKKIDAAIKEGMDVTLELYPYPYGASYAAMYLPSWASEGGPSGIMKRLEDKKERTEIGEYIEREFGHLDPVVSYAGLDPSYEGKSFSQIADEMNLPYGQAVAELLRLQKLRIGCREAEPNLTPETKKRFEKDLFELLERPYYMVGSDAIHLGQHIHPRAFGSFAKLLRLARQHHFPLETLIQRMCHLPAKRFGLSRRGLIQKGFAGDIVVFDPAVITDTATTLSPRESAKGIGAVLVNGLMTFENGTLLKTFAGQALKRR